VDEGVFTEVIMIVIVLVIGVTLITTMTPLLRSIETPQTAPLAEVVYTYSEYNITLGEGMWELYLYIYDDNPVNLNSIIIFSPQDLFINQVRVLDPDGLQWTFTSGDNLDLTLDRGLYIVKIEFDALSPNSLDRLTYVVTLTGGNTLSGDTPVRLVT